MNTLKIVHSKKIWLFLTASIIVISMTVFKSLALAQDYMVEFFEEHYKEKLILGAGEVKIYHSWQVKTKYGDKLLVLVGKDAVYRDWLRKSLRKHKIYVVKIPDQGVENFVYDRAIAVDIQQVHPVWDRFWKCAKCRHGGPPIKGKQSEVPLAVLPEAPQITVQ